MNRIQHMTHRAVWARSALAALLVGCSTTLVFAEEAGSQTRQQRMDEALANYRANGHGEASTSQPGRFERAENATKRGVRRAGAAVERTAKKVGHAVEKGAHKTGDALRHTGEKIKSKVE